MMKTKKPTRTARDSFPFELQYVALLCLSVLSACGEPSDSLSADGLTYGQQLVDEAGIGSHEFCVESAHRNRTLAVTADMHLEGYGESETERGAVLVFERLDSGWERTSHLTHPSTKDEFFGRFVAVDDD
ncbi:MAG: hypothetical protein WBG86_11365, partial [Polyangiales bacterium]